MTYVIFDFSQSYPLMAAVLFVLSGLYLRFVEVSLYRRMDLARERGWAKWLGWTNIGLGCCLVVLQWLHHSMWWL